ncbi:hypothetical protein [Salibaculum griseiflavum]|uniref:hypothetical protein n=1 Tax=Salibaculum griseiflavum TaxID=1914409 RepID=UPI0011B24323|nr:hypothetical protein [Salibaculum griseiflavum]
MTVFAFDARAALQQARKSRALPTPPTLPTDRAAEGEKVGTVGKVGTVRASDPEIPPDERILDLDHHASRIAALADPDGVARTPEAIAAVWDWAEALARQTPTTRKDDDK